MCRPVFSMEERFAQVERLRLSTSLTAVKWIDRNTIITGMGGEVSLRCHNEENKWEQGAKEEVFSYQSIYGLEFLSRSRRRIFVYGGVQYALIHITSMSPPCIKVLWSNRCEDWILDGSCIDENMIVILTAHGKLIEINSDSGIQNVSTACLDRSILYSARIVAQRDWNNIILLGGTVHNQIIVWARCNAGPTGQTIATLSGHKGVLFSVKYDEVSKRICSTSDDRTARIWHVELGDGDHSLVKRWSTAKFSLELTLFGHNARVWDSAFLPFTLLATIAEDGGVIVWNQFGECLMQNWVQAGLLCLDLLQLPEVEEETLHPNLSSCDARMILSAGGNDGSLYLFPVCHLQPSLTTLPLLEGVPRQICLSTKETVLAYTDHGHLMVHSTPKGWNKCFFTESLASYCIMSLSICRQYLAVADILGTIYLFSVNAGNLEFLCSQKVLEGRVFSLHWACRTYLVACGPQGRVCLFHIVLSSLVARFSIEGSYELPECKERWTTCAVLVDDSYLVCGDRMGSIHLFSTSSKQDRPVHSLTRVHGNRGVNCIKVCAYTTDETHIMSCGRDGTLRKHRLLLDSSTSPTLEPVLYLRLSMDWASHIITSSAFGELIIGFHNVYFCVWSLREQRYLLKLKCWGGHRSWDFTLNREDTLSLVFIKDKSIYSFSTSLYNLALPTPLMGLHSKTINTCCWMSDWGLYVTGSEDTSLKVCSGVDTCLSPVCSVESHLSSIRALHQLKLSNSRSIVISAGGRGQLKLWTVSPSGELCERGSHMLRREKDLLRDWRSEKVLDEPEVRYMDLSLFQTTSNSAYAYAVASDGIIRVFKVNLVDLSLKLVQCEETYKGRCFLKVVTVSYHQEYIICVSSSTDGFINFWLHSSSMEVQILSRFKVHSGGVNALSASFDLDKNKLLVASGGDDSCIVLSLYFLKSDLTFELKSTLKLDTLHSCQVTGLELVDNYLVSVGLDGRLCLLQWCIKEFLIESTHLITHKAFLSDIQGLLAQIEKRELSVCLFGIGIEVVRILLPLT